MMLSVIFHVPIKKTKYWVIDNFIGNKDFDHKEFFYLLNDAVKLRVNGGEGTSGFFNPI